MDIKEVVPWAQIVSSFCALLALVFAAINLRKVAQSVHSQTYQRLYELMINLDRFFAENPEVRKYVFNTPRDAEVTPETVVGGKNLFSVAEMMIDYFDNVYHQRQCMPGGTFRPFSEYMTQTFNNSKLLRDFLAEREAFYPEEFKNHLMEGDASGHGKYLKKG